MDVKHIKEQIKNMRYSFSRLYSFCRCKYEWLLKYTDECDYEEDSNFFAQYGSLMHTIIEKYAKRELEVFDIIDYYNEHFSDITYDANNNDVRESYYQKGLAYCEYLMTISLDDYRIIGIELKIKFKIGGKKFIGYVDMVLEDINTGEIVVVDHKSEKIKFLKDGSISKTNIDDILKFKKQMYLYSIGLYNLYGKYPSKFIINLFNIQKYYKFDINEDEFRESIKWAEQILLDIQNESEFDPSPSYYYCKYLCGFRNYPIKCKQ